MRILYGVVGEGMGHATRSRVVIEALRERHQVTVVASGRAHDFLSARFPDVHKIWGATLAYQDNAVSKLRTALQNARAAVGGVPENVRQYLEIQQRFTPECVITDFDSFAYLYALNWMLPVLSIDNMQIINRCRHAPEILEGHEADFALAKGIVKAKVPGCQHYFITTFFHPPLRKERTSLHPPILRPEILAARPERGEHLLVYQTSTSNPDLPAILRGAGLPVRVYGLRRDLREDQVEGNVTYRPFSEQGFIDDLRTARAVLASGGFTLMGEAVHLHKPMLCVPLRGQFEQVLNARYLAHTGYGAWTPQVTARDLERFLASLPAHEARLAGWRQDGNRELLAALEDKLAEIAAGRGPCPSEPEPG